VTCNLRIRDNALSAWDAAGKIERLDIGQAGVTTAPAEHFDQHDSNMHTLKVIAIGFALLLACGAVGYGAAGAVGVPRAALIFLPLWAIGAGINMYLGIKRAGYSFADEAPIFLLVFAVPAASGARRMVQVPAERAPSSQSACHGSHGIHHTRVLRAAQYSRGHDRHARIGSKQGSAFVVAVETSFQGPWSETTRSQLLAPRLWALDHPWPRSWLTHARTGPNDSFSGGALFSRQLCTSPMNESFGVASVFADRGVATGRVPTK